jgi:hypothetical protein
MNQRLEWSCPEDRLKLAQIIERDSQDAAWALAGNRNKDKASWLVERIARYGVRRAVIELARMREVVVQHDIQESLGMLETMVTAIEQSIEDQSATWPMYAFKFAKKAGIAFREGGYTSLHPVGPRAGVGMIALLMAEVDVDAGFAERVAIDKLVDRAGYLVPTESPRSEGAIAKAFAHDFDELAGKLGVKPGNGR